jgi:hypothetical protein
MVVVLKTIGSTPKLDPVKENGLLEVVLSIEIAADWRRVFHAITLPEYIEAWLQIPEVDRIECHSEWRSLTRFRIDMFLSTYREEAFTAPAAYPDLTQSSTNGNELTSIIRFSRKLRSDLMVDLSNAPST